MIHFALPSGLEAKPEVSGFVISLDIKRKAQEKLIKEDVFYTRTMAKVYADQGNLLKAAEIYRYLLEREPESQDLKDAISEIERKLYEKSPDDLIRLFNKWVDLLLKYHNVQRLMRFKNYLRGLK